MYVCDRYLPSIYMCKYKTLAGSRIETLHVRDHPQDHHLCIGPTHTCTVARILGSVGLLYGVLQHWPQNKAMLSMKNLLVPPLSKGMLQIQHYTQLLMHCSIAQFRASRVGPDLHRERGSRHSVCIIMLRNTACWWVSMEPCCFSRLNCALLVDKSSSVAKTRALLPFSMCN
jgi:hypothetical protein